MFVASAPDEVGFTLVEVLAASVVAVLAVTGLAYSFGTGRALMNDFEVGRAALAVAQQRLELMGRLPGSSSDFSTDSVHVRPFDHNGRENGTEEWVVSWYDDPATATANDLKRVTVTVRWSQAIRADTVSLSRLFLPN